MQDINEIISSLSDDDIKMLKGIASSILGEESPQVPDSSNNKSIKNDALSSLNINQNDLNFMLKAKSIIDKMNNTSSKNADLINALKPHLSPDSRDKADKAIRILKLFDILPYLKDMF